MKFLKIRLTSEILKIVCSCRESILLTRQEISKTVLHQLSKSGFYDKKSGKISKMKEFHVITKIKVILNFIFKISWFDNFIDY